MSGVAGWEPASDAEIALYEALAAGDQEGYFHALGRANLLLPVSADAAAGRTAIGWGTWTANNHTHLLAFTSDQSMRTCLAQHVGGARRMSLRDLAAIWPNNDWWLAVNPGLPIEGYLPPWFVSQLARGDARLPGPRSSMPRDRLERVQALERAKAAKAAALPREPIRTVATAGGPLALPPASTSPRWARGPASIVDAEEVTTVMPSPAPVKPAVPEPHQPPAPARTSPSASSWTAPPPQSNRAAPQSGRTAAAPPPPNRTAAAAPPPNRTAAAAAAPPPPPPSRTAPPRAPEHGETPTVPLLPQRTPAAPEPYQPLPAPPSRTVYEPNAGRYEPRPAQPERVAQPERAAAPIEDRWAGLVESRWAPLAQERDTTDQQDQGQPEEQKTQRVDRGSLFEEQKTQRVDRGSFFGEEQPTQRVERRSLFEPEVRDEQPTMKMQRPVAKDEKPASQEKEKPAARAEGPRHAEPEPEFVPANAVEEQLHAAAEAGNTDAFLSTLLLATVLIPKASGTTNGKWRPQPIDGEPHIVSYTSTQHLAEPLETIPIKFVKLISDWPDPNWSFAVNPGTPVGATLPGGQLLALANWAAEVGLGGDEEEDFDEPSVKLNGTPVAGRVSPDVPVMQKAIAPSQVGYYLERGYDRVTGFVHRAHEVGHLKSASQMRAALGLDFEGSPFSVEADEIYLLRWSAHRPSLYRIPYGGQSESAMHAMQGWVIERGPFRGNGFTPGETNEVIAEFKVDSARLPHGARLLRLKDGAEEMVAIFDADTQKWLRTDGGS